jgi:hypothetical protein
MPSTIVQPLPAQPSRSIVVTMERAARQLSAAATAGAAVGFVVGGWGSRLAMMLLARLNPQATGRISDDGFVMGRFDLGATLGLVAIGTLIGILGGIIYLAIRGLRFGPGWFRWASVTVGPAVVVGTLLVHTDGVDFRILEPVWLAIALFVAIPAVFAGVVAPVVDRWAADGSWFLSGSRWRLLPLALLALPSPTGLLAAGYWVGAVLRELFPAVERLAGDRRAAWLARSAFVVLFVVAAIDLTRKTAILV